jgi:hypothetical protein
MNDELVPSRSDIRTPKQELWVLPGWRLAGTQSLCGYGGKERVTEWYDILKALLVS